VAEKKLDRLKILTGI